MSTVGHPAALRRLGNSHPKADEAKAVAVAAVTSSSLYCGKRGLERGTNYLVALIGGRLVILRPSRQPGPQSLMLEFAKGTYRITDVVPGSLNTSFVVSRPYGNVSLRVLHRAWYSVNTQVLELLVASAAPAERAAQRTPPAPLQTAGEVRVFARMCAAFGAGAEKATAVAEAEVTEGTAKQGLLSRNPSVLLATFPDRLVLLDPTATTHVSSVPIADFARGAATIALADEAGKHLNVTLTGAGPTIALKVARYGEDRLDDQVREAIRALGAGSGSSGR